MEEIGIWILMLNIKDDRKNIIIDFMENELSGDVIDCLRLAIRTCPETRYIGINLANIKTARNEFFSLLKEFSPNKNICLYNLTAEINLLLFLMNYSQYAQLFASEMDFKENKRSLICRDLKICAG